MTKITSGERLQLLRGWRFPASAVKRAAMLNDAAFGNTLNKTDLILCSDLPGQGRARQFCLADAYQLAIFRRLSFLTGQVAWPAAALNRILFPDIIAETFAPGAKIDQLPEVIKRRAELCEDIDLLPLEYRNRDDVIYFYASVPTIATSTPHIKVLAESDPDALLHALRASGVFLCVTYLLDFVDTELAQSIGISNV